MCAKDFEKLYQQVKEIVMKHTPQIWTASVKAKPEEESNIIHINTRKKQAQETQIDILLDRFK